MILVLVFVAMASQDVLQALYQRFMDNKRPWLAGNADGLLDILSIVFVIGVITNHARTLPWLLEVSVVLFVSSTIGTVIGYHFEAWIEKRWGPPNVKPPFPT